MDIREHIANLYSSGKAMKPLHIAPLQPLRVPADWRIVINNLCEIDPSTMNDPSDERWEYFEEDMFSARHDHYQVAVDVGVVSGAEPRRQLSSDICCR
ncbi:hypothetical protein [Sorangium sp. So ce362]|uniref:hypothetical protein n=1 Tax=Sorangium sp. So ce362 TaxID=3133303 RepID=UPI003F5D7EFD